VRSVAECLSAYVEKSQLRRYNSAGRNHTETLQKQSYGK
jgi:hypothetical protein